MIPRMFLYVSCLGGLGFICNKILNNSNLAGTIMVLGGIIIIIVIGVFVEIKCANPIQTVKPSGHYENYKVTLPRQHESWDVKGIYDVPQKIVTRTHWVKENK